MRRTDGCADAGAAKRLTTFRIDLLYRATWSVPTPEVHPFDPRTNAETSPWRRRRGRRSNGLAHMRSEIDNDVARPAGGHEDLLEGLEEALAIDGPAMSHGAVTRSIGEAAPCWSWSW